MSGFELGRLVTIIDERFDSGDDGIPRFREVLLAAVVDNPMVGRYQESLDLLSRIGGEVARSLCDKLTELVDVKQVIAVGKGCAVGQGGEPEHAAALIGPRFMSQIRSSLLKTGPGTPTIRGIAPPGVELEVAYHLVEGSTALPSGVPTTGKIRVTGHPQDDEALLVLGAIEMAKH